MPGVSISPVAFLVVQQNTVKLLPVDHNSCLDRLLDYVPDLIEKLNTMFNKQMQNKKEENIQEDKRKEREKREEKQKKELNDYKEERKIKDNQENRRRPTSETIIEVDSFSKQPQTKQVIPKRTNKYHKPEDLYEFEYDETQYDKYDE